MAFGRLIGALGRSVARIGAIVGLGGDPCCCGAAGCYQRWTAFYYCETGVWDDPAPGDKTCFDPAPNTRWVKIETTGPGCTYEIYVSLDSDCIIDDDECYLLDDTEPPPLPYGGGSPPDCCCYCGCCPPFGTVLNVTVDATGMIPTPPDTGEPGGWHTVPPGNYGDWHVGPWVATPQTIFTGGVLMPYSFGGGEGANCDTPPSYTNGGPSGAPPLPGFPVPCAYTPRGPTLSFYPGNDYQIQLTCNDDGTYTVVVDGNQQDDVNVGAGVYYYYGEISGVVLACVNGRPTGTVNVPMGWQTFDSAFDPNAFDLEDCGFLTVIFA